MINLVVWPVIISPMIAAIPAAFLIKAWFNETVTRNVWLTWAIADASGNYFTLYLLLVSEKQASGTLLVIA